MKIRITIEYDPDCEVVENVGLVEQATEMLIYERNSWLEGDVGLGDFYVYPIPPEGPQVESGCKVEFQFLDDNGKVLVKL